MKIRRGFVTNSSSSSYICDVCDQTDSDMYGFGYKCVNDHYLCDDHIIDFEHMVEDEVIPEKNCPLCTLGVVKDDTLFDYLLVAEKLNKKEIIEHIRNEYKTLKNLQDFLTGWKTI